MSDVGEVDELLAVIFTDAAIEIWWSARNRNFGSERPRDLWRNGTDEDRARVLAEAERLAGGGW